MGMFQERGGSKGAGAEQARRKAMVEEVREAGGVQIMEDFVGHGRDIGFLFWIRLQDTDRFKQMNRIIWSPF